jgi:hypothetical protein
VAALNSTTIIESKAWKDRFVRDVPNRGEAILYAGLLDIAHQMGLLSIVTQLVESPSPENNNKAIVHATVTLPAADGGTKERTFTGIGDADSGNVTRMIANAIIRMAETRAKARALRDAVNVGMVAYEELPGFQSASAGAEYEDDDGRPSRGRPVEPARIEREDPRPAEHLAPPAGRGSEDRRQYSQAPAERTPARAAAAPAARANGRQVLEDAETAVGVGEQTGGGRDTGAGATPKQVQTIQRMARAAGKTISTENLTRAKASEIISGLIGEMGQMRVGGGDGDPRYS